MNASPEQLSQRFDTSDVKKPLSPTSGMQRQHLTLLFCSVFHFCFTP